MINLANRKILLMMEICCAQPQWGNTWGAAFLYNKIKLKTGRD